MREGRIADSWAWCSCWEAKGFLTYTTDSQWQLHLTPSLGQIFLQENLMTTKNSFVRKSYWSPSNCPLTSNNIWWGQNLVQTKDADDPLGRVGIGPVLGFQNQNPLEYGIQYITSSLRQNPWGRRAHYLEDHLSPGHAFHDNFSVTGRRFPHHLWANGREVEQDHLQGMGVQQQLWGKAVCYSYFTGRTPNESMWITHNAASLQKILKINRTTKIFLIPLLRENKKPQLNVV